MRETGLFDLLACYDLNPNAMQQCEREDGAKPARSYEELLATPDAEAVVIATRQVPRRAGHRGRRAWLHVFVEKPMCSTPEEVQALVEVAGAGRRSWSGRRTMTTPPTQPSATIRG